MNSLQLWLAIVGGLVLAAVVGHGAWQTRRAAGGRARPAAGAPEPAAETAPATEPVMREPAFDLDDMPAPSAEPSPPPAGTTGPSAEGAIEERLGDLPPVLAAPPRRPAAAPAAIDPQIDAIATLSPPAPVAGEQVLAHMPATRRAGGKPFLFEGRRADTGAWEVPQPGQAYDALRAGLQIVNRTGSVNEIEYSEFVQKIRPCAQALGAQAQFPEMLDVVARGRALDQVAMHHDAQLAMRLRTRPGKGSWPLSWVQQHAGRHGFVNGTTPGRLVLPGRVEGAPPVLELVFDPHAALAEDPGQVWIAEMSLLFDVPQTAQADQPFNAWCAAGQALAIALDADVTDDDDQPLNAASFRLIAEDLEGLYAKLDEFGLPAGAPATRRLFS